MAEDNEKNRQLDYLLAVASDRISGQLTRDIGRRGISMDYWRILSCLEDEAGKTMGELARQALLSLPTATRIVDKMVAEALVYRAPGTKDRRKVLVYRSDKGKALWAEAQSDADDLNRRMADVMGEEWVSDLVMRLNLLVDRSDDIANPGRLD